MEETSIFEKFELQLNETAKDFLKEGAKWAYFLSILGFIGIGLMVVLGLFMGVIFSSMGNGMAAMGPMGGSMKVMMSAFYIVIAAVYFFPVYYLNKFATNSKKALRDNDSESLATSFGYLKSHYKFIGILTVSIFVMYALILVFVIIGAVAGQI